MNFIIFKTAIIIKIENLMKFQMGSKCVAVITKHWI